MTANKLQSKTNILNSFSESTHHTIATDNQFYVSLLPPPVPDHKQKGDISLPVPTSSQSSLRRKPCRPAPPPPAAKNSNKAGCLSTAQPPCQSPSRVKPSRPAPPPPAAKTSIKSGHSFLPKPLTRSSSRIKPCRPAPPPPVSYKSHHASPAPTSFQKHLHQVNSVRGDSNQLKQPSTSVLKKRRAISLHKTVLTDDRSSGGERLTLSKLIEKHSQSFPINVQVVQGFYGEHTAIASGEVYTIHSVKHTNVVTLKDSNCQMSFPVPFNSPARFGIVYEREDSSCLEPLEFGSVGELMDSLPLPRVVCAKTSCCDSDNKSLVRENEILAIEGIQKEKHMLKVVSVTDQKKKFLQRECMGHFTTDPCCTQLYLSEIISYVPDPLPLMARMFLSAEGESTFPEYLFSKPVLLTDQYMETFLIASPVGDKDVFPDTVVELPTSLDIEVRVIPPKSTERVNLYAETTENVYAEPNTQACMDRCNIHTYAALSHFPTSSSENHNTDCSQPELPKYQPLLKSTLKDAGKYINVQIGGTPSPPTTPSHAENLEKSPLVPDGIQYCYVDMILVYESLNSIASGVISK